jgi:hypothetical protein
VLCLVDGSSEEEAIENAKQPAKYNGGAAISRRMEDVVVHSVRPVGKLWT